MGHQNSDAAARSVAKSKKVEEKAARTPEQRIRDIRMNAEGLLSVPNAEVVFLLDQYDILKFSVASLSDQVLDLTVKLDSALETVATTLGQRAGEKLGGNQAESQVVELDGQRVKVTAEPLPRVENQ